MSRRATTSKSLGRPSHARRTRTNTQALDKNQTLTDVIQDLQEVVEEVYSDYAESDDDFQFPEDFDEARARRKLMRMRNCAKIVLSLEQQREMGIEIGVNVTAEHPWKQLTKTTLQDYLAYDTVEAVTFKSKLRFIDDDELILVGYAAPLSEENDTFLFFENTHAAQDAGVLIRQIEASERRKARRAQIKQPRKWKTLGSEAEVENMLQRERKTIVDVEIQSMYPMHHPRSGFRMRRVADVADGYAELVPKRVTDFVNVFRKRVDAYVQSSAPRVAVEQQTDPLFPANAWTQYLYEFGQDKQDEPENEDDDDQPRKKKGNKEPTIPVIPSYRVDDLIENLVFNDVNMYRNDYPFISKTNVRKYQIPVLSEVFCFVDMSKSIGRIVSSIDWHPVLSGLAVVSYAFTNMSTMLPTTDKTDTIQRAIIEPNRITMWSFDEKLYPKLELATSREISCLSYCPYDENVILAGTNNGQLIVYDMTNRLKQVETEEVLTAAQQRYRLAMRSFLSWTKQDTTDSVVRPVAVSALQHSHRAAITSIQWMARSVYLTPAGLFKINPKEKSRYIVTTSLDCTFSVWDLDFFDENAARNPNAPRKLKLPAHMVSAPSDYERLNNLWRPNYVAIHNRPITSLLIDCGQFSYNPLVESSPNRPLSKRTRHRIVCHEMEKLDSSVVASTIFGRLASIVCEGSEMLVDVTKREQLKPALLFANIHDGTILRIERNPFVPELFLTIGRKILALWRKDLLWTPVFWRQSPANLTDVRWSKNRACVFFATRNDGTIEAWDILARTDAPCLKDSLGGSMLTQVSQHKLTLPTEVIAVGDFNSSLRVFEVPKCFSNELPDETQMLQDYVQREVDRKETLNRWQEHFFQGNASIREAKARAAAEAALELERLEKEAREREDTRIKREEAELHRQLARERAKNLFDMPEKLEKKWDEMNIRRLMRILMSKKQVDPQLLAKWTAPEKARQLYNAKKTKAMDESFSQTSDDLAAIRAALIPIDVPDEDRINYVKNNLKKIQLEDAEETEYYTQLSANTMEWIGNHNNRSALDIAGILRRGRQRREVLNKSLGANTQHRHTFYENVKRAPAVEEVEETVEDEENEAEPEGGEEAPKEE